MDEEVRTGNITGGQGIYTLASDKSIESLVVVFDVNLIGHMSSLFGVFFNFRTSIVHSKFCHWRGNIFIRLSSQPSSVGQDPVITAAIPQPQMPVNRYAIKR
jgi:hypothetical protein